MSGTMTSINMLILCVAPHTVIAAHPLQVCHLVVELRARMLSHQDAPALLAYYYLTTLDEEFKHYSKRKFTLATLLYISNRYIPLVFAIL